MGRGDAWDAVSCGAVAASCWGQLCATASSREPALILPLGFHLNESLQYFKHTFDSLEHITATINTSTS